MRAVYADKFYKMFKVCLSFFLAMSLSLFVSAAEKEFYQIRIYHLKTEEQENRLDSFLRIAYVPALHRNGITQVGVFKPRPSDKTTERLLYVLVPFKSLKALQKLDEKLADDKLYQADGKGYLDAVYLSPPYERFETILLQSFEGSKTTLPQLTGNKKDRVYELRSYEGYTEKIFGNKVDMFTKGDELGIFKRLGFNAIFYAEVIAGGRMPNLMYMTSFENQAERDKHWEAFGKDPAWKKLSAAPEYQNNVSKIDMFMLYPVEYSDL